MKMYNAMLGSLVFSFIFFISQVIVVCTTQVLYCFNRQAESCYTCACLGFMTLDAYCCFYLGG